ncbi:MAG: hypothetical protein ACREQN_07775 [Candidatus Binataceae bacterium]
MPFRTAMLLLAALSTAGAFACQRSETNSPAQKSSSQAPPAALQKPEPPTQSGVYGFSGAKVADGDANEGVVGECIWIYDEHNQTQVAKGDCYQSNPGTFRVPLKPGRYVVRGPGGNTPIDVRNGGWVKIQSIVTLPLAP